MQAPHLSQDRYIGNIRFRVEGLGSKLLKGGCIESSIGVYRGY